MKLKITFPVLLLIFSVAFTFGQTTNIEKEKMIVPDPNAPQIHSNENYNSPAIDPGELIFNSEYDYMCNNAIGPQIDLVDLDGDGWLDPIMTQMQRLSGFSTRSQKFAYKAFGLIDYFNAFDTTGATSGTSSYGYGSIQYCVGGDWDGDALLFAHSNAQSWHSRIDLTNFVPVTPYPTTSIPGSFPSFVYLQSGRIIANNTTFVYYSSTDYGETFDSLFRFGDGQSNFIYNPSNTPAEIPIFKSDDDTVIASIGGFDGCFPTGNPDGLYWYGSTDAGNTWFGYAFGYGSGSNPEYGQIINRDYAPYFTNFSQINYNVSNDGVTHLVCNGYGGGVLPGTTDTVNVFPILYWNSRDQNWIAITDPLTEAPTDGFGNFVFGPAPGQRLYPGNGIGQAYPNVATSADGQIVFVAWQGFEYTGSIGNSEWNIYPGDGGSNSGPIYYTDLYYNVSEDYGVTWSTPQILKGDADVMEQYPYLARRIVFEGNTVYVHYIYQEDAIPGLAIFNSTLPGQNSFSDDTRWMYDTWMFTPPSVQNDISLNDFTLEQNYPNPFNPGTVISFKLSVGADVSLKVFDVLGNEVAILVNEYKPAGRYDVDFNSHSGLPGIRVLPSGVYFYQLKAGSLIQTKKMVLLK